MSSTIEAFFAQYPDFTYDSGEAANNNFYRLCDENGWEKGDGERDEAYEEFKVALVQEFNRKYGRDENSLEAWQALCRRVGIYPIPDNLNEARERVRATHVNLVDLTQAEEDNRVTIFPTEKALSDYTIAHGRYFPAESAYAGGLLQKLLRHILHPRDENFRRGARGRNGRGRRGGGGGGR